MRSTDVQRFRETSNPRLSDRAVGIADIMERSLPDSHGVVAPRISVGFSIYDEDTKESRHEVAQEGTIVAIGNDRYCVERIEMISGAPGWVSLRKLER
jgi:hypothetical protein